MRVFSLFFPNLDDLVFSVMSLYLHSVVSSAMVVDFFVWFLNVLINYWAISWTGPKTERRTILRVATHETELGDHDFCLSRSHYTDTDPTSKERAATAGIEWL